MKKLLLSVLLLVTSNAFSGPNIKKAEKLFKEGCALLQKGQQREAIKKFNKGLEIVPTSPDLWDARACAYSDMHEFVSAVNDFSKAISFAPNGAFLYFKRGLAYQAIGNVLAMRNDMIMAAKLGNPDAQKVVAVWIAQEQQLKADADKRKQDFIADMKNRFAGLGDNQLSSACFESALRGHSR